MNLPEGLIIEIAELFKNLGDSSRVKILWVLSQEEMCVNDLSQQIGLSQSALSHQLRILRQSKLVKSRKVGKNIYYSLADDHVIDIFTTAKEHVLE